MSTEQTQCVEVLATKCFNKNIDLYDLDVELPLSNEQAKALVKELLIGEGFPEAALTDNVLTYVVDACDIPEEWFWGQDDWCISDVVDSWEREHPGCYFFRHCWHSWQCRGEYDELPDGLGYIEFEYAPGSDKDYDDRSGYNYL